MSEIAICVFCSVAVSVLLKLAPRWRIDVRQMIAGGYAVAAVLCALVLRPNTGELISRLSRDQWVVLLLLGILLPVIFLVLAESVKVVGVVKTDAAQRLSLLLPLIAAYLFFGEVLTGQKLLGMLLGLIAIGLIVARETGKKGQSSSISWHWPLLVFLGMGIIDILFKQMAKQPFAEVLQATFLLALAISGPYIFYLFHRKRATWAWRNSMAVILLGALNFGNILFYLRAHRHFSDSPTLVFSAVNIGVIVCAALVGLWFFKERLNRLNYIGLSLAVLAIFVIAKG